MARITRELRDAQPAALTTPASSPFTVATPTEVDFYSAFNSAGVRADGTGTGALRLTRIYLDTSGSAAQKTLYWQRDTNASGGFDSADRKIVLARSVVNTSVPSTGSPTRDLHLRLSRRLRQLHDRHLHGERRHGQDHLHPGPPDRGRESLAHAELCGPPDHRPSAQRPPELRMSIMQRQTRESGAALILLLGIIATLAILASTAVFVLAQPADRHGRGPHEGPVVQLRRGRPRQRRDGGADDHLAGGERLVRAGHADGGLRRDVPVGQQAAADRQGVRQPGDDQRGDHLGQGRTDVGHDPGRQALGRDGRDLQRQDVAGSHAGRSGELHGQLQHAGRRHLQRRQRRLHDRRRRRLRHQVPRPEQHDVGRGHRQDGGDLRRRQLHRRTGTPTSRRAAGPRRCRSRPTAPSTTPSSASTRRWPAPAACRRSAPCCRRRRSTR